MIPRSKTLESRAYRYFQHSLTGACSTICPRYMTIISSDNLAITPRLWVISIMASKNRPILYTHDLIIVNSLEDKMLLVTETIKWYTQENVENVLWCKGGLGFRFNPHSE